MHHLTYVAAWTPVCVGTSLSKLNAEVKERGEEKAGFKLAPGFHTIIKKLYERVKWVMYLIMKS